MFGFLVIFLLSTAASQLDGTRAEPRVPRVAMHSSENRNPIFNPYDLDDRIDYDSDENRSEDQEEGSRRLFDWFTRLFKTTTPRPVETTVTTESVYSRELKERIFLRALQRNLTHVLQKLSDIQKQVSFVMEQKEFYSILTRGKPNVYGTNNAFYFHDRRKREANKTETAVKTKADVKPLNKTSVQVNATECPCNLTSGRRLGVEVTPTEVKNKLLLYLQESFQEIKAKISSLKELKEAFSDNVSFKIGYILANIDTLEVSVMNLKRNMDKNKDVWQDNKILEIYDTLKVSNQAVTGLIEALKTYLDKLSYPSHNQNSI